VRETHPLQHIQRERKRERERERKKEEEEEEGGERKERLTKIERLWKQSREGIHLKEASERNQSLHLILKENELLGQCLIVDFLQLITKGEGNTKLICKQTYNW
jgi:hypothetical protein